MAYEATSIPAVFGLNKFLWAKIKEAGILDETNYGGLVPIVPVQETPLLQQAMDEQTGIRSFPFIVYSWYQNGHTQDWFMECDNAVYRINVNPNDGIKLRQLVSLINDVCRRWDDSAQALNDWIQASNLSQAYKDYDYKYINIQSTQGGQPTDLDHAPITAMVTVKIEYTHAKSNRPL